MIPNITPIPSKMSTVVAQKSAEPSPAAQRFSALFAAMGREGQPDHETRSKSGPARDAVAQSEDTVDSQTATEAEALAADAGENAEASDEEGRAVLIPYPSAGDVSDGADQTEEAASELSESAQPILGAPSGPATRGTEPFGIGPAGQRTGPAKSGLIAPDSLDRPKNGGATAGDSAELQKQVAENQSVRRLNLAGTRPNGPSADLAAPGAADPEAAKGDGAKTTAITGRPGSIPPLAGHATLPTDQGPKSTGHAGQGTIAASSAVGTTTQMVSVRTNASGDGANLQDLSSAQLLAATRAKAASVGAAGDGTGNTAQTGTAATEAEQKAMAIAFRTSAQRAQAALAGDRIMPQGPAGQGPAGDIDPAMAAAGQPVPASARFIRSSARNEAIADARTATAGPPATPTQSATVKMAAPVAVSAASTPISAEAITRDAVESEELAPLPPLFGEARSHAQASQMAGAMQPVRGDHAASVIRQMIEVSGQLKDGAVELRLNPEELGRVRMHMTSSDNGIVMHITSERPETLDLLRRNIDQLHRELTDLGYASVDFTFGQQGGETDTGDTPEGRSGSSAASRAGSAEQPAPRPTPLSVASDGLDIRL